MAEKEGLGRVFELIRGIRKAYPQLAYLLDDPEVGPLLLKLQDGQFDASVFQSKLYKTRWWRRNAEASRKWGALEAIDRAEARARRQQAAVTVNDLTAQLGINLKEKGAYWGKGKDAVHRIADLSLRFGWNQDQLTDFLLSQASWKDEGQAPGGGIGVSMRELRGMAQQWLVAPSDKQLFKWSKKILGGEADPDTIALELAERAKTRWGDNETIAGIIDRGGSPFEYFEPIRGAIAQELEIAPEAVDLLDPKWAQVINRAGQDGKLRPMTQTEAVRFARNQPEWGRTRSAQQTANEMGATLLQMFGKRR